MIDQEMIDKALSNVITKFLQSDGNLPAILAELGDVESLVGFFMEGAGNISNDLDKLTYGVICFLVGFHTRQMIMSRSN